MKMILKGLLIGTIGLTELIHAKYSAYSQCNDSIPTFDMFDCIGEEYSRQDAKLNKAYKHVMKKFNGNNAKQTELKELQRIWINYRDAKCQFNFGLTGGGTFDKEIVLRCSVEETRLRANELESLSR